MPKEPKHPRPLFAYPMNDYVACRSCASFSRIEYCVPLPMDSSLMKSKFCPHCGAPYEFDQRYPNGGPYLLGDVVLDRQVTLEEADQLKEIYQMWDVRVHSTFKLFLESLRNPS